jgi:hypothetical protein
VIDAVAVRGIRSANVAVHVSLYVTERKIVIDSEILHRLIEIV